MHRRWEVSLLGVGMERLRRLYHSMGYECWDLRGAKDDEVGRKWYEKLI